MKTIGLIGGVSWQASAEYYRIINQEIQNRLGPTHSAKVVMVSLDFDPVARLEHEQNWAALAAMLIDAIKRLERAGSEFVLIGSNTLHRVAPEMTTRKHYWRPRSTNWNLARALTVASQKSAAPPPTPPAPKTSKPG